MVHPSNLKTRLACILEASESTRLRVGESLPNHHEDHITGRGEITALQFGSQIYSIPHHHEDHIGGKGNNSLQHHNLVRKFILMPSSHENSSSKGSSGQGMGKIGEKFGVEPDKSQK